MTAPERRRTRNKSFSCHSTAEIFSITTCHKFDNENSLSFQLEHDYFLREVLFNKTPFSAVKQLRGPSTALQRTVWVYAPCVVCMQQLYQTFHAQACLCLAMRRQTTSPKQGCIQVLFYHRPNLAHKSLMPSTARGVLLHVSHRLHTAMRCSGAELEEKGTLCNLLPALCDWIQAFKTGLLLSSCILDVTLRQIQFVYLARGKGYSNAIAGED